MGFGEFLQVCSFCLETSQVDFGKGWSEGGQISRKPSQWSTFGQSTFFMVKAQRYEHPLKGIRV